LEKKERKIATNRKASFDYVLSDRFVAGMSLRGTEVKSLRNGAVSFGDAFCILNNGEVILKSLNISTYDQANIYNHEPLRDRKLLLKKQEIKKLDRKTREKGFTMVPTRLFFSDRGFAKCEFALAKGKKTFDKRDSLKDKDMGKQLKKMDY